MFERAFYYIEIGIDNVVAPLCQLFIIIILMPMWLIPFTLGYIYTQIRIWNGHQKGPQGAYPSTDGTFDVRRPGGGSPCR